jgi:hypothetical protein
MFVELGDVVAETKSSGVMLLQDQLRRQFP